MKKTKFLLSLLALCLGLQYSATAQTVRYTDLRIVKRPLAVGKAKSTKADSCAWIEIGDTSSSKGLLLNATDTSKIYPNRKAGLMIYRLADSSLYIHTGKRWKKVSAT